MHLRQAGAYILGLQFARGGQLPFELFDALAMSEEEAGFVQTDVNIERLIRETTAANRG